MPARPGARGPSRHRHHNLFDVAYGLLLREDRGVEPWVEFEMLDAPAMATGRLELRWYLREQTVSRVRHRYGNVIEPAGTE